MLHTHKYNHCIVKWYMRVYIVLIWLFSTVVCSTPIESRQAPIDSYLNDSVMVNAPLIYIKRHYVNDMIYQELENVSLRERYDYRNQQEFINYANADLHSSFVNINVGGMPTNLVIPIESNRAYIHVEGLNELVSVDIHNAKVTNRHSLGNIIGGIVRVSPSGNTIFFVGYSGYDGPPPDICDITVLDPEPNTMTVIDVASDTIIFQGEAPYGINDMIVMSDTDIYIAGNFGLRSWNYVAQEWEEVSDPCDTLNCSQYRIDRMILRIDANQIAFTAQLAYGQDSQFALLLLDLIHDEWTNVMPHWAYEDWLPTYLSESKFHDIMFANMRDHQTSTSMGAIDNDNVAHFIMDGMLYSVSDTYDDEVLVFGHFLSFIYNTQLMEVLHELPELRTRNRIYSKDNNLVYHVRNGAPREGYFSSSSTSSTYDFSIYDLSSQTLVSYSIDDSSFSCFRYRGLGVSNDGSYAVVSNANLSSVTIIDLGAIVSREEETLSGNVLIDIYPNPSTGSIYIESAGHNIEHVGAYDMLGRQVYLNNIITCCKESYTIELGSHVTGTVVVVVKLVGGLEHARTITIVK